jgi:hypothetical protein
MGCPRVSGTPVPRASPWCKSPATASAPAQTCARPETICGSHPPARLCGVGSARLVSPQGLGAPPPRLGVPRGRRRQVDTPDHVCPQAPWASQSRSGWGNSRASGPHKGRRWRHLLGLGGRGDCLEPQGTLLHGTQGEAAEPREAFARFCLHEVEVDQGQMDELLALLSAVKAGAVTAADAIKRLSRSPSWVWGALAPGCKLILPLDVGGRPLAMAQRLVHPIMPVRTPPCAPRFLTDGWQDSLTALVMPSGPWRPAERRRAPGAQPRPRGVPFPRRLSAQLVQTSRRRRLVGANPIGANLNT